MYWETNPFSIISRHVLLECESLIVPWIFFLGKMVFTSLSFGPKTESDIILHGGPWLFDGRQIILKIWTDSITLERDLFSSVPIWIKFPSLHLKFWSRRVLSKAASLIGKPLYMDNATTTGERQAYARCFVELSAANSLPERIFLEIEGGERTPLKVEYE